MQFNSVTYLLYLPLVVLLYYQLSADNRRRLLLLASYGFYWVWSIPFSGLLVLSTCAAHLAALRIEQARTQTGKNLALGISLAANLGTLFLFKYANFFSDASYAVFGGRLLPELDWVLPLGISFYTFQTMSYTLDVYRGKLSAERSLLSVALYVSFFPQLVAGPIVRADVLFPQLAAQHKLRWSYISAGTGLLLWGMTKKVYVADPAALIVNEAFSDVGAMSGLGLLIAIYAFAVQIYCDFSAYSDMAIGSALLLGIQLPRNFDNPYLSCSIREFWRRWHISLSNWLRDYLYIALGGSRRGELRTYINLMITMLLGGLWHGAGWNWVVWGGLQGLMMSLERAFGVSETPPQQALARLLRWLITFHLVCISWVFFRAQDLPQAAEVLSRIVSAADGHLPLDFRPLAALAILLLVEALGLKRRWLIFCRRRPVALRWISYAALIVLVLTFDKATNPEFIYFQF